jgi:hypothetical protein
VVQPKSPRRDRSPALRQPGNNMGNLARLMSKPHNPTVPARSPPEVIQTGESLRTSRDQQHPAKMRGAAIRDARRIPISVNQSMRPDS